MNAARKSRRWHLERMKFLKIEPALEQDSDEVKRFPGWVRLLLLIGVPGLFWIGVVLLILRLTHR